jgi:Ca-activated chloride channel family protein
MTMAPTILAHPWIVSLLLAMPALSVLQIVASWRGRRLLLRLGQPIALAGLLPVTRRWRWLSALLFSTGVTTLLIGAAGPQWGKDPQPSVVAGRDIVILLDMSNSMRATDAPPDRFHRAVAAVEDLVASIRSRGGHRLGLVVFAADARVVCPLTYDYDLFQMKLEALDMDHAPPSLRPVSGPRSGTRIGAGLKAAASMFDPGTRGYQDVILLSDGDDPAGDGEWEDGLKSVESDRICFDTVGIGDPTKDSSITIPGSDERVQTHLHEAPLTVIARQSGGFYLPARLEFPRLTELFKQRIEPKGETTPQAEPPPLLKPRQVWFYAGAIGFFGLGWLLQLRRSDFSGLPWRPWRAWIVRRMTLRPKSAGSDNENKRQEPGRTQSPAVATMANGNGKIRNGRPGRTGRAPATMAVIAMMVLFGAAPPASEDWERLAVGAFDVGRYDDAARFFRLALERSPRPGRLAYNAAIAFFNEGRYRDAERLFRCDLESADDERRGRALYNLGTCLLQASEGRDSARLGEAINCFDRCLKMPDVKDALHDDACYNMELAKQFWRRLHSDSPPPENEPSRRNDAGRDEQPDNPGANESDQGPGDSTGTAQRRFDRASVSPDGGSPGGRDKQPIPGAGSMSQLTDNEQLNPLSPKEARELLKIAEERISRERRALQHSNSGQSRPYPDH